MNKFSRTKIIATVGPSCNSYDVLLGLVKEGVNVFRFNFSHGTHEGHKNYFDLIHRINLRNFKQIGILADLQGPKIRVGNVKDEGVLLEKKKKVIITDKKADSTAEKIYVSYPKLATDVKIGEPLLIDDGKIVLIVDKILSEHEFECVIKYGGMLSSKKGVNLPETKLSIESITPKDKKDLAFAIEHKASWIALSFVRSAHDIVRLKSMIPNKDTVKVIAKIEKPEAIKNLDEIIAVADGIMVARGDLGVELPIEQIPLIQKEIVAKCIAASKPVIVATQMMESMINNPVPTRAEVTDVANAMIDGADAVMLSGESSVGKYPIEVVQTLKKIIIQVEKSEIVYNKRLLPQIDSPQFLSDAVCYNACKIAEEVSAKAILGMTRSGYTAFTLSSYRPHAPIYIFTDNEDLLNILSLSWGVKGFFYNQFNSTDETIQDVIKILKNEKLIFKNDIIVNTGSMPIEKKSKTNMLKLSVVE